LAAALFSLQYELEMPFFCPKKPKQGKYDGKLLTENAANGPNELYFGQSMIIKCEKGGAQKQRRKAKSANDSREPLSQQDGISIKQPKERRKLSRNKWGKFPEDISNGGMQDPLQPFARGQEVREATCIRTRICISSLCRMDIDTISSFKIGAQ